MSGGPARVWIARAQPGADATAAKVAALGLEPLVAPLLAVRFLRPDIDLDDVAALAFTSANGVRAFAGLNDDRRLPAWTVGAATAATARDAGFAQVRSADGDVAALAAAIAAAPPPGPLLHLAAREPAGDLAGGLAAHGVSVRTTAVYETTPTTAANDPEAVVGADIVLLHSPRAARLLAALIARRSQPGLRAACLSPAVMAALDGALDARTAHAPDEAALLGLLQDMARDDR